MGCRRESRPTTLMKCILVWSWCISFARASADASNSATLGIGAIDNEVIFGGYDVRELQTAYNQSVVNIAVLFDTANTFDWARQIIDFTFTMINNRTDRWHDDTFPDGTIINYTIAHVDCSETAAARAYWDIRNEWGGIVHGVA